MELPPEIKTLIQARLERAKESNPGLVSKDGKAVFICGGIGYDCYISPDGDIFVKTYDPGSDGPPARDRSRLAQIACLVLGSKHIPALEHLLPVRPPGAPGCDTCEGEGRLLRGTIQPDGILCKDCSGLGWIALS